MIKYRKRKIFSNGGNVMRSYLDMAVGVFFDVFDYNCDAFIVDKSQARIIIKKGFSVKIELEKIGKERFFKFVLYDPYGKNIATWTYCKFSQTKDIFNRILNDTAIKEAS
jgi:hypothetical protein